MQEAIEGLVQEFEDRKLTRRQLVAAIAGLAAGGAAKASGQTAAVAQARTLNHVSLAVTDVEQSAEWYGRLLDLEVVSRPGNGGINLGLRDGFLGLYQLSNPGSVNHFCLGVDNYDPERIAERLETAGIQASINTNPNSRTSGGDQLYFRDPDGTSVQLSANGFMG